MSRPTHLTEKDASANKYQRVILSSLRRSVLKLSHGSVSGHMGIYKDYRKILYNFYLSKLKLVARKYVKTCHVPQQEGKGNQSIYAAPVQPIPVTPEPFENIATDCVGQLPCTKKSHQYLLTVMCPTTRYLEALRSHLLAILEQSSLTKFPALQVNCFQKY